MILIDALRRLGETTSSLIIASYYIVKEPIPSIPLRTVTELIYCKKASDQQHTERQHALIISINGASYLLPSYLSSLNARDESAPVITVNHKTQT